MIHRLIVVILAVGISACTSHEVYDAVQTTQRNECERLQLTQREDCLKRLSPDYKEYERERQKLHKK